MTEPGVLLADGRRVLTVREWAEPTRYDPALGEVGRWTGAVGGRTILAVTGDGEWVLVTDEPHAVTSRIAAGWFRVCGMEREMPAELVEATT